MRPMLCALALVGCASDGGGTWAPAFDDADAGSLSGVWGSAPDDVWIVGGREGEGTVRHYDGTGWSPVAVPDVDLLVWVHGTGPNDLWMVGRSGSVLHYDGAEFAVVDVGTDDDLWGVFAVSPTEIWMVGGDIGGDGPVLQVTDGTTVTDVGVADDQNPVGADSLFKIWGIGDELFALGQNGLIVRRTPDGWVRTSAGPEASSDFVSLWGTGPDDIVAVGGRGNAQFATWDGTSWTGSRQPATAGLNAVWVSPEGEVVVGGEQGRAGTFDRETRTITAEPVTFVDVHAAWGDGDGRVYAVGGTFTGAYEGAALVRE